MSRACAYSRRKKARKTVVFTVIRPTCVFSGSHPKVSNTKISTNKSTNILGDESYFYTTEGMFRKTAKKKICDLLIPFWSINWNHEFFLSDAFFCTSLLIKFGLNDNNAYQLSMKILASHLFIGRRNNIYDYHAYNHISTLYDELFQI